MAGYFGCIFGLTPGVPGGGTLSWGGEGCRELLITAVQPETFAQLKAWACSRALRHGLDRALAGVAYCFSTPS